LYAAQSVGIADGSELLALTLWASHHSLYRWYASRQAGSPDTTQV
jgi:hypothetical protein